MKPFRRPIPIPSAFVLLALLGAASASAGVNRWTSHGPLSPFISAVALDPADALTLYAASSESGFYKSEDGGLSWTRQDGDDPALASLTCLAVDPSNPSSIYLGTATGVFLQSHDRGQTWSATSAGQSLLSAIAIDRVTRDIYAANRPVGMAFDLRYDTPPVSKSADGGKTWSASTLGRPRAVYALLADALHGALLAGSDFAYSQSFYDAAVDYPRGGGVERTADGGATWELSATDLKFSVTALAAHPVSGLVYAATSEGGFHRSADQGATWTRLGSLAGTVAAIAVDPSASSTIYAALSEGGILRSGDGGATWRSFDYGLTNRAVRSLAIDSTGRILHVGTNGGGVFDRDLPAIPASSCDPGTDHLCLLGSRFRVDLTAIDPRAQTLAPALGVTQADRFGYFSFPTLTGDPSLPEVFVKMLDATSLPGQGYWIFYGGLTDVQYGLTITDTATGRMQFYDGEALCGSADVRAFPPGQPSAVLAGAGPAAGPLVSSSGELSLLTSRFRITLSATNPRTAVTASGVAIPQGDRFGYFSLPAFTGDPTFPEVFVKMLDATSLPGGDFWLFHVGLTGLHYTLTLTDSVTGAVKTYQNDPSDPTRLCGGADTHLTTAMPFSLTGAWTGTAAPTCNELSTFPASASATQSANQVHLELSSAPCFGALRFDGLLKGTALNGTFRTQVDACLFEAAATGTGSASGIHLASGPQDGTCGQWKSAKIDLTPAPVPTAGAVAGPWTGTFVTVDPIDCDGNPTPAQADFQQNGSAVSGSLNATENFCGFAHVTFKGTLQGSMLTGTITGERFTNATATGTLSGTTLEIRLTNSCPGELCIPGGQMLLHR